MFKKLKYMWKVLTGEVQVPDNSRPTHKRPIRRRLPYRTGETIKVPNGLVPVSVFAVVRPHFLRVDKPSTFSKAGTLKYKDFLVDITGEYNQENSTITLQNEIGEFVVEIIISFVEE